MLKNALMATAITVAAMAAHSQTVLVSESFDDVSTLGARGWVQTNLSTPVGTGWLQGNPGIFSAQSGAANSFISGSFLNVLNGLESGTLANWLISPTFSTASAGTVSFFAQADIADPFFDQIAFGLSAGSSSTTAFALAPVITLGGIWTRYDVAFAAQGESSVGRFAIEYVGLAGDANYIGIDSFLVTAPIPEPSSYALMALGIAAVAVARRRRTAA